MKLIKNASVMATLWSTVLSTNSLAATSGKTQATAIKANAVTQEADSSKVKLMAKLAKIEFFSAEFTQKIFDETGNELQQGNGLLSVSKPNLVNWQTTSPDESLIVSDGSNLWFYDPFVEQVSVYSLANAIANTPILLITSNDARLWRDYNVAENVDNVELSAFNILDATGQLSVITLANHDDKPDMSLFTFTVPEGVYLDDQR